MKIIRGSEFELKSPKTHCDHCEEQSDKLHKVTGWMSESLYKDVAVMGADMCAYCIHDYMQPYDLIIDGVRQDDGEEVTKTESYERHMQFECRMSSFV